MGYMSGGIEGRDSPEGRNKLQWEIRKIVERRKIIAGRD